MTGAQALGPLLQLSKVHELGAGLEVEQPGLEWYWHCKLTLSPALVDYTARPPFCNVKNIFQLQYIIYMNIEYIVACFKPV